MRRLVVFAEREQDTIAWMRRNQLTRGQVRHFGVHDNPHKIRGLSEAYTAFVFLTDELPSALAPILDVYEALRVPEFHRTQHDEIVAWLRS